MIFVKVAGILYLHKEKRDNIIIVNVKLNYLMTDDTLSLINFHAVKID